MKDPSSITDFSQPSGSRVEKKLGSHQKMPFNLLRDLSQRDETIEGQILNYYHLHEKEIGV
jgi:hypothetical protein